MNMNEHEFMRHTLATLAFRLRKCIVGAPKGYPEFTPGEGARSSLGVMSHLSSAMTWTICMFEGEFVNPAEVGWSEEILRFEKLMKELDQILIDQKSPKELTMGQILQGPLSDAMTHIGQLALYRRLVGSPIPGENFTKAEITSGDLSLR